MRRTLFSSPAMSVEVTAFEPGARQPRHRDRCSRVTLTLRGGFLEESANGAARLEAGDVLFKSRHAAHEDCFGDDGACLASVVFHGEDFETAGASPWRVRREGAALRHALAALEAAVANDPHAVETAASDLIGACEEPRGARTAPAWLGRLKEAVETTGLAHVDVAEEALAAGVHPAHASRLFRRCFGVSITEYAQAHGVRRALGPLAQGASLSEAALAAGFYDQSHMSRVFRRVAGRTPGAHRALLAAAVNIVQDPQRAAT